MFAEPHEANQDVKSADNETMVSIPSVFEKITVFLSSYKSEILGKPQSL